VSAFDVNNEAAVRMWGKAVEEDYASPSFFYTWVDPPPRLTRWQRLRAWVLRLFGRGPAVVEPGRITVGLMYGVQKTSFTANPRNVLTMDVIESMSHTWDLNVGGTLFRVETVASNPITENQALHAVEARKGWPLVQCAAGMGFADDAYRLVRLNAWTLVRVGCVTEVPA
jgi:hypothetical protein